MPPAQQYVLVKTKSINQYITSTGQKTGTSKTENQVQTKPMVTALVAEYQNLNSGSLRTNGLNSWSCFVGRSPPFSIASSSIEGSNLGERKARNRLRR